MLAEWLKDVYDPAEHRRRVSKEGVAVGTHSHVDTHVELRCIPQQQVCQRLLFGVVREASDALRLGRTADKVQWQRLAQRAVRCAPPHAREQALHGAIESPRLGILTVAVTHSDLAAIVTDDSDDRGEATAKSRAKHLRLQPVGPRVARAAAPREENALDNIGAGGERASAEQLEAGVEL